MKREILLVVVSCHVIPSLIHAQAFKILGTRPLGMGGAHVAVAKGAVAQYWNPAGLIDDKGFAFEVPVGASVELTKDLLKEADDLSNLATEIENIQNKSDVDGLSISEYRSFLKAINEIQDLNTTGLGALAEVQGGVNVRVNRWAVSVNNFSEVGADPFVDTVNIALQGGDFGRGIDVIDISALDFDGNGTLGDNDLSGILTPDQQTQLETQLATVVDTLVEKIGIELPLYNGARITAEQAANELIAYAAAPSRGNMTAAEIISTINEIERLAAEAADFLPSVLPPLPQGVSTSEVSSESTSVSFENNQTNLTLRGASITEASLSYATRVPVLHRLKPFSPLSLGANLKYMQGYIGYGSIKVLDEDAEFGDILDDYNDNQEVSSNIGIDLAALYNLKDTFLRSRFGLLVRNVNSPSFKQPRIATLAGMDDFTLDPQVRAGYALYPFNWWVLAADMDLTENKTLLPGYNSRLGSLGTEINVVNRSWFNLALRGGLLKNLAENAGLVYTAGVGLNLFHFHIDAGGAMSAKKVEIEDAGEFPSNARAAITLSLRF